MIWLSGSWGSSPVVSMSICSSLRSEKTISLKSVRRLRTRYCSTGERKRKNRSPASSASAPHRGGSTSQKLDEIAQRVIACECLHPRWPRAACHGSGRSARSQGENGRLRDVRRCRCAR
jgi:hypothetical protein